MIRICVSTPPATTKRPAAPEPMPPVKARSNVPSVPVAPGVIAPWPTIPRPIAAAVVGKMPLPYSEASRAAWAVVEATAAVAAFATATPALPAAAVALPSAAPALPAAAPALPAAAPALPAAAPALAAAAMTALAISPGA
ncbi:MAG: hypothetical protein E5Y85_00955 [Mesorhizobium sp.]|nr:MAG: hypothetical protein E5Y85_00955 [Mesorhizobium sp.]